MNECSLSISWIVKFTFNIKVTDTLIGLFRTC